MAKTPPKVFDKLVYTKDWEFTRFGQWVRFLAPRLVASIFVWWILPNAIGAFLIVVLFGIRVPGDFESKF